MQEYLEHIDTWLARGERVDDATVVKTMGSSPRQVGAKMVVASGGASGNTLSGSGSINDTLTLLPGSRVTYTLVAKVAPSASGTLVNTARLIAPGGDTASDSEPINASLRFIYLPLLFSSDG